MEAVRYLKSLNKFGIKPGLKRINLLLRHLDNPQEDLNVIHIGGTNGKGSTSAILTSIYREAGFKVGTYNSPHIVSFTERIRINDSFIEIEQLDDLVAEIKPVVKKVSNELNPLSFFEVITALALLHFKREEVDLAVLEVGMGGRWDATNVVDSLVSVITNISLEHTDLLGDTLAEIAREKAGIIKYSQPVVTGVTEKEALEEIKSVCSEKQARLINIHDEFAWKRKSWDLEGQIIDIATSRTNYQDLNFSLLGSHQIWNLLTSLGVVEALIDQYSVSEAELRQGVKRVSWPGRLEVISDNPTIILDGAHNRAAAVSIKQFLAELEYDRLILVLGILDDKDIEGIGEELASQASQVIITKNKSQRAANLVEVAYQVKKHHSKVKPIADLNKAIETATNLASDDDLVLITGSLYTVREARQILK
jgi:dihydrofolate synthase/folylpolyglutamate synthase